MKTRGYCCDLDPSERQSAYASVKKKLQGIKLKEYEKKDKYLDLARELKEKQKKKLWNTQVTIIPIVIGSFGTVTKGLLKRL